MVTYTFKDEAMMIPAEWNDIIQYDPYTKHWVVFDWCKDKNGYDIFAGVYWVRTKQEASDRVNYYNR